MKPGSQSKIQVELSQKILWTPIIFSGSSIGGHFKDIKKLFFDGQNVQKNRTKKFIKKLQRISTSLRTLLNDDQFSIVEKNDNEKNLAKKFFNKKVLLKIKFYNKKFF